MDIEKLKKTIEKVVYEDEIDVVHFSWEKKDLNKFYRIICKDYLGNHFDFHIYLQVNGITVGNATFSRKITNEIVERIIIWVKNMNEKY